MAVVLYCYSSGASLRVANAPLHEGVGLILPRIVDARCRRHSERTAFLFSRTGVGKLSTVVETRVVYIMGRRLRRAAEGGFQPVARISERAIKSRLVIRAAE